jgi:hypothetical protein
MSKKSYHRTSKPFLIIEEKNEIILSNIVGIRNASLCFSGKSKSEMHL